jgi:hypothetical protein
LAQRLGQRDSADEGNVERSGGSAQGDDHSGGRTLVDVPGHAGALAPEQDRVVGGEGETVDCDPTRCRHQDQARPGITIGKEGCP